MDHSICTITTRVLASGFCGQSEANLQTQRCTLVDLNDVDLPSWVFVKCVIAHYYWCVSLHLGNIPQLVSLFY